MTSSEFPEEVTVRPTLSTLWKQCVHTLTRPNCFAGGGKVPGPFPFLFGRHIGGLSGKRTEGLPRLAHGAFEPRIVQGDTSHVHSARDS